MEHADTRRVAFPVFGKIGKDRKRVVVRVACMNDHRLADLNSGFQALEKQLLLLFGLFRFVEIVEPGFADRDRELLCRQLAERGNVTVRIRHVAIITGGGINPVRVRFGHLLRQLIGFRRTAHRDHF